ncbi:MAG: hypothetical protein AB7S26_07540 [Sandaracinaceae bacterium]
MSDLLESVTIVLRTAERFARPLVPTDVRLSLPIPLGGDEGHARFSVLVSRVEPHEDLSEPPRVIAPRFVITLDATDGQLIRIRRTTPRDFRIEASETDPLGPARTEKHRMSDKHLTARARAKQAIDRLAPAFFGLDELSAAEAHGFAASFLTAHEAATEPTLVAFERVIGRRFFAWLESL